MHDDVPAGRRRLITAESRRPARAGRVGISLAAVLFLAAAAVACRTDDEGGSSAEPRKKAPSAAINPGDFSSTVDHPLVPLSSVRSTVFEGSEPDPDTGEPIETRAEKRVLDQTERVAGVEVLVVEVEEFENGELVEHTFDYFAQRADGSVWYLGERVDDIEGGEVVGHEGQWLAGEGNAKPGLFMPAEPKVGQTFEQERAPGIAEDRSTVLKLGIDVTVPAGSFSDCIKTEDFAPLDNVTEFKYYCPDVGLVREETASGSTFDLVRYG